MTAAREETFVRITDILSDKVIDRFGNDGVSDMDNLTNRIANCFTMPVEIYPNNPANTSVNYTAGEFTLPDGVRIASLIDGFLTSQLTAGVISFSAGTVSSGATPTFSLPTMVAGNWVRALVQYKVDTNSLTVTFGTQNSVLGSTGIPAVLQGYNAFCLLELFSSAGGVGSFSAITRSRLIRIVSPMASDKGPVTELQTVTVTPQTVFTLTTITIPKNRSRLLVFVNGILQRLGTHYSVTSDTQVTMSFSVPVNGEVVFVVL